MMCPFILNQNLIFCFFLLSSSHFAQRVETSKNGETLNWGNFEINNNQWGIYKIKKGTYHQTIYTDNDIAGWKWETPGKSYGVLGYPMIFMGTSAWNTLDQVETDNYYKNLNDLKTFNVDYQTQLHVDDKKYNLAFDFWLHHSPEVLLKRLELKS